MVFLWGVLNSIFTDIWKIPRPTYNPSAATQVIKLFLPDNGQ
jgi:hypothetical protein